LASWLTGTVLSRKSKLPCRVLHGRGVGRQQHLVGTEAERVRALVGRSRDHHDMRAERLGEFQPHMAEPAKADDADGLARTDAPVLQRRIGGDAGAEQRCHRLQIEALRDLHDEMLVDDDPVGIAAEDEIVGSALPGIIGPGRDGLAILLQCAPAGPAMAARIHHAADARQIAGAKRGDGTADRGDAADDLVAGHHRIERIAPVVAALVEIGVADAAIEDLDLHIARAGVAPLEAERLQGRILAFGHISDRIEHRINLPFS